MINTDTRKIIFLDIDGVLNCKSSPRTIRYEGYRLAGIDDDKVEKLKQIVDATGAEIVLTSTWKAGWEKTDKDKQDVFGDTIDKVFADHGLSVSDKTEEWHFRRGEGILEYMSEPAKFVILDDEPFDYEELGLDEFWVQTHFGDENGGLQDRHVEEAIKILQI